MTFLAVYLKLRKKNSQVAWLIRSNAYTCFQCPHMSLSALQPSKERRSRLWVCHTQIQTLSMTHSDKHKTPVLVFGPLQLILILVRSVNVCMDSYQLTYNFTKEIFCHTQLKKTCKQKPIYTVCGYVKWCCQYGKQYGDSLRHSK